MIPDPDRLLSVAHEAVDIAQDIVRHRPPGTVTQKGGRDMASDVDYAVEGSVRGYLQETTPAIGFLGEEEPSNRFPGELFWTLDPVDGTANFIRGIPLCAISLGLVHRNRAVLGVIDLPFLKTRYAATEHNGAFRNGELIHIATTNSLNDAIVTIGDYAVNDDVRCQNRLRVAVTAHLADTVQRVRMLGSAAIDLAWLAEGKTDAVVMLANKPWDTAAGVAIARAAGARVVDVDGSEHSTDSTATIAGPPFLVDQIIDLVHRARTGGHPW